MKYQKINAAATTPATPPTTPPTIAPVLLEEAVKDGDSEEEGVDEEEDVGDAVGVGAEADVVVTIFPSSRYTPLRWLQHVCPGSSSMLPQQRLLSPQVVNAAVALS